MASLEQLRQQLAPLLEALGSGGCLRLVAWPGRVWIDRAEGSARVEVAWSADQHGEAIASLDVPATFDGGLTAAAVAGSLVLRRPPDPMRRMEDLSRDGRLSPLAARFLAAAQGCGRNVLVAAPWAAGVELVAALLAEGQRPAVAGRPGDAAPPAWPVVMGDRVEELWAVGADRMGAWSLAPSELVSLLGRGSGVAAWIDAGRLDRALLRFEAGVERAYRGATTPLQVLAGIDLVVVAGDVGGVRVRQIAEICLAEEGYRPQLLFTTDVPPVPTALVPVATPTFLAELARAGHQVLADELRHAVPAHPTQPPAAVAPPVAAEPVAERQQHVPPPQSTHVVEMPTLDPALADAPPPGWELDQLGDDVAGEATTTSSEAAALAASFGLGPPPPPPGVAPIKPDVVSGEGEMPAPPTFAEAMARARERDQEELQPDPPNEDSEVR